MSSGCMEIIGNIVKQKLKKLSTVSGNTSTLAETSLY